ncbi:MAG TPA: hypothetical protein VF442_01495 [Sphingobium sp.]
MALLATSATLWLYLGCALASLRLKSRGPVNTSGDRLCALDLVEAGLVASGSSFLLMAAGRPFYWRTRGERRQRT